MEQVISEIIAQWPGLFIGIFAIVVFWYELSMRRKLATETLRVEQKKLDMLESKSETMESISRPIAENVSSILRGDSSWAFDAMEKAKLGLHSQTLFGDRLSHFRDEKQHLGRIFAELLLKRCRYLAEEKRKNIYVLIDSGTTLYPLFGEIGRLATQSFLRNENWIVGKSPDLPPHERSKLKIVTNNLPGTIALMESGRPNPYDRYSDLAVDCRLLPGTPLAVYSAVTGEATENALIEFGGKIDRLNSVIISVVTGNWVRIRRTGTRCPVPLARGLNHKSFKQMLIGSSLCTMPDEVYVVTPLGKIFANASSDEVNKRLGFDNDLKVPSRAEYEEVDIKEEMASKIKLITTSRHGERTLSGLSAYLNGQLGVSEGLDVTAFQTADLGKTSHLMLQFDELPNERGLEEEVEFPHSHTRTREFMRFLANPSRSPDKLC